MSPNAKSRGANAHGSASVDSGGGAATSGNISSKDTLGSLPGRTACGAASFLAPSSCLGAHLFAKLRFVKARVRSAYVESMRQTISR